MYFFLRGTLKYEGTYQTSKCNVKVLLMDGQSKRKILTSYVDAGFELVIERVCISFLHELLNMKKRITNI